MTDEQIRTIWREMRPMQGDADPVAFARRLLEQTPVLWGLQRPDGTIDDGLCSTNRSDCEFWSRAESEHQSGWPIVALGVIEETA